MSGTGYRYLLAVPGKGAPVGGCAASHDVARRRTWWSHRRPRRLVGGGFLRVTEADSERQRLAQFRITVALRGSDAMLSSQEHPRPAWPCPRRPGPADIRYARPPPTSAVRKPNQEPATPATGWWAVAERVGRHGDTGRSAAHRRAEHPRTWGPEPSRTLGEVAGSGASGRSRPQDMLNLLYDEGLRRRRVATPPSAGRRRRRGPTCGKRVATITESAVRSRRAPGAHRGQRGLPLPRRARLFQTTHAHSRDPVDG